MNNSDQELNHSLPKNAQFKPLTLDMDKHRHHIAELDLSDEDERELLSAVWQLMIKAVDLGIELTQNTEVNDTDRASLDVVGLLFGSDRDKTEV